ncbi:replication initiation protein [Streptomyces paromomycinus]|uniref:Replication initiation protein n=1 Tax=Streptomyces paromomycinus TaxID=92743 RepID=A0A401VTJ8_STREY|nr:replication initiation protein [Streptomyces paromomycinus]
MRSCAPTPPPPSPPAACSPRRASRCPACSRLYAVDTYHLIRAGLSGGKTVPDTVRAHPRVFVTLTPPSFGPVHNRPTTPGSDIRPCRCRKLHEPTEILLGTPLNPATYDYAGAVLFNAHTGALWARFTTYLRREIAAQLGMTQKAAHTVLRVSFAKVAEYQQRGLVHFHAVIRLDGPDGTSQPPPPYATVAVLTDAVRAAAARVRVTVESDAVGERELSWGEQLDVREIAALARTPNSLIRPWPPTWRSTPTPPTPSTAPCSAAPARDAAPPSYPTELRSPAPRATGPDSPAPCPGQARREDRRQQP